MNEPMDEWTSSPNPPGWAGTTVSPETRAAFDKLVWDALNEFAEQDMTDLLTTKPHRLARLLDPGREQYRRRYLRRGRARA